MISFQKGFINPQLENGPVATAYIKAMQAELGFAPSGYASSKHYAILEYFYNLSIDTANSAGIVGSGELASIGYLVGYPWPSVYAGDFNNNSLQFITAASFPGSNTHIGFSSATSGIVNGTFISAVPQQTGKYVDIVIYRQLLKFVTTIKWSGLTIPAIDTLISNVLKFLGFPLSSGYTIKYGANNDIYINFSLANDNIGAGWLYVLQLIFNRVCTVPQVNLSIS